MGMLIPFQPRKRIAPRLDADLLRTRVLAGEAHLIGIFWFNGGRCACYQYDHDDETALVFEVKTRDQVESPNQGQRNELE